MSTTIPFSIDDPINKQILRVSEDRIQGFVRNPLGEIAELAGIEVPIIIERLKAMLEAGTIRRIRQTMMTTSLAPGALVAWSVPNDKLNDAFDYMFQQDPFSGHVVIRTTDEATTGSRYRLWTTLKVPRPYSLEKHAQYLQDKVGADKFVLLPAKNVFALGVGHVRRRELDFGERTPEPGRILSTTLVDLTEREWQVLTALKREFEPHELVSNIWTARAAEAGVPLEEFFEVAESLDERKVIGRFSTFLEHVKKHQDGKTVTRYNGLFHWRVPEGMEVKAGQEVGRHMCMTHAYWREGGPEFKDVNVMGVAHGMEKDKVLKHKAAIDQHLEEEGIPVLYTNVFWGGRSEIKPSEISPIAYQQWCEERKINPDDMKD